MGQKIFILCFIMSLYVPAQAAQLFLGALGAQANLEFKNIMVDGASTPIKGDVQLVGVSGGLLSMAPNALGYEISASVFGVNSQKIVPNPNWGTPWYYMLSSKGNYVFPLGIFVEGGLNFISNLYENVESQYVGVGVSYGLGFRFNSHVSVSINAINSSALFAGENGKVLRGTALQANYAF